MWTTHARPFAIVAGLAATLAAAYLGYVELKKRELRQDTVALVQDSTSRLGEALELVAGGSEARGRLEASFRALAENAEKLRLLDASLNPPLVNAADAYITDVQAMLRRQLAAHQAHDALRADRAQIAEHLRAAGSRSSDWIRQALALKERLEKNFFDYRLAAGGMEKSFRALRDSRRGFEPLGVPVVVIEEQALASASERLNARSAALATEVESTRQLPLPR